MLSQLRARGTIKHQASDLNLCSGQLEEQRTDACSPYQPDGHHGDGIFLTDAKTAQGDAVYPKDFNPSNQGRCPCHWQGGWNEMIFKIPSKPNHSMTLRQNTKPGCPSAPPALVMLSGQNWAMSPFPNFFIPQEEIVSAGTGIQPQRFTVFVSTGTLKKQTENQTISCPYFCANALEKFP